MLSTQCYSHMSLAAKSRVTLILKYGSCTICVLSQSKMVVLCYHTKGFSRTYKWRCQCCWLLFIFIMFYNIVNYRNFLFCYEFRKMGGHHSWNAIYPLENIKTPGSQVFKILLTFDNATTHLIGIQFLFYSSDCLSPVFYKVYLYKNVSRVKPPQTPKFPHLCLHTHPTS